MLVMDPVYGPLVVMLTMIFIKFALCVREPRRGARRVGAGVRASTLVMKDARGFPAAAARSAFE